MDKEAKAAASLLTAIKQNPFKTLGLVATDAAIAGGAGAYIGHRRGKVKGTIDTANELTGAFTKANTRENAMLASKMRRGFDSYNRAENRALAKHYMKRGFAAGSAMGSAMRKQAFENIYQEAFNDEFEKQANVLGGIFRGGRRIAKKMVNVAQDVGVPGTNLMRKAGRGAEQMGSKVKSVVRDVAGGGKDPLKNVTRGGVKPTPTTGTDVIIPKSKPIVSSGPPPTTGTDVIIPKSKPIVSSGPVPRQAPSGSLTPTQNLPANVPAASPGIGQKMLNYWGGMSNKAKGLTLMGGAAGAGVGAGIPLGRATVGDRSRR